MTSPSEPSVRIDRWLSAARIYKSRTIAQEACAGGHVRVNGQAVRASHAVRVGDEVSASAPRGELVLEIKTLAERRLAPDEARALYLDHSPPPAPREPRIAPRERGAGRPTKADRRATDRLRFR
jgi:ribosome-associated heat shock protein Hsp15